jgi:ankyrin repeat protein
VKIAISRLLIDHGANLYPANRNGWTPLHTASHSGQLGVVKLLLRWGADINVLNKANKLQPNWHWRMAKPGLQGL